MTVSAQLTRSSFTLNLSTKITLSFVVIGLLFIAVLVVNYQSGKQVSSGLSIINHESSPVVQLSSDLDSLVRATEPVVLRLTTTRERNGYQQLVTMLNNDLGAIEAKLTEFEQLELNGDLATEVDRTLSELGTDIQSMKSSAQILIGKQGEIVDLTEHSISVIKTLHKLQTEIGPLLQDTLLQLDEESVIAIVNEVNASITAGMLVIERVAFSSSLEDMQGLQNQFFQWQNMHSNLLPTLIFASDESGYRQFVKRLSALTLSLLDAIEGESGLLNIQRKRLELEGEQLETFELLKKELSDTSQLTGSLLERAFDQNHLLSEEINSRAEQQNQTAVLVGSAVIVGIALISIWLGRFLRKAIGHFVEELGALSRGELRNLAPSKTDDEFGRLNDYLCQVVENLKQTIRDIENSSNQVEKSVNTVSASSTETRQIVQQQKTELDAVATALVEMSSTAQEVAQHTENTHDKIMHAGELSKEGRSRVKDSHRSVEEMATQTAQTISAINNLDSGVKSIESIIDTITGIADQTNLLALNAAIEAARAGDHGRGFAVVAEQVRELATRTQESTLEIQDKIASMISDSKVAVEVINRSEALANNSLEQATMADDTIKTFEQVMTEIQDLSHLISTAAEQQAVTLNELDKNINQVADLADQTNVKAETAESEAKSQVQIVKDLEKKVDSFKFDRQ